MKTRKNLLESTRREIILFCNAYLDKHPKPGFFYNQHELIRECVKRMTEMSDSNSYDLAITLLKIKNKVIAHEKQRINITPGMFFTTERGKFGQFRLVLENSMRALIGRSSYEDEIEFDVGAAFRPLEMTERDIDSYFNIELNTTQLER